MFFKASTSSSSSDVTDDHTGRAGAEAATPRRKRMSSGGNLPELGQRGFTPNPFPANAVGALSQAHTENRVPDSETGGAIFMTGTARRTTAKAVS